MNYFLLIFDILCLPITLVRLCLIYFYGSKYNIKSLKFLDVAMHADNKYFNQMNEEITINTLKTDIRVAIYESSKDDLVLNNNLIYHERENDLKKLEKFKKELENLESETKNNSLNNLVSKDETHDPNNILLENIETKNTNDDNGTEINSIMKYKKKIIDDKRFEDKINDAIKHELNFMSFDETMT